MVRALYRQLRIEAVCHDGGRVGLAVHYRELCCHTCRRRQLILSSQRHEYRCSSYGAVETLYQPLLAAAVEIRQQLFLRLCLLQQLIEPLIAVLLTCCNVDIGKLLCSVGIEKIS